MASSSTDHLTIPQIDSDSLTLRLGPVERNTPIRKYCQLKLSNGSFSPAKKCTSAEMFGVVIMPKSLALRFPKAVGDLNSGITILSRLMRSVSQNCTSEVIQWNGLESDIERTHASNYRGLSVGWTTKLAAVRFVCFEHCLRRRCIIGSISLCNVRQYERLRALDRSVR